MARQPTHPGALLREDVLPALKRPKTEIASLLGISRQHLYAILNEQQGITADVAVRLGKLFGNGPELWINLQQKHDLWRAQKRLAADIKRIPTLRAAGNTGDPEFERQRAIAREVMRKDRNALRELARR